MVYFDFSKAFDSVNHDLILHKLKVFYSIDGRLLKFLSNYLSGRKQCVTIENYKSSPKKCLIRDATRVDPWPNTLCTFH